MNLGNLAAEAGHLSYQLNVIHSEGYQNVSKTVHVT